MDEPKQEEIEAEGAAAAEAGRPRKSKKRFLWLLLVPALAAAAYLVYRDYDSRVYRRAEVEAGDIEIAPEDFSRNGTEGLTFTDAAQLAAVDTHVPGDYALGVRSGIFTYKCVLTVRDTVPPRARAVDRELSRGETLAAEDFVADIEDETAVRVSFAGTPDFSETGGRDVEIVLEDLGGNRTALTARLVVAPLCRELTREAGDTPPELADFLLPDTPKEQSAALRLLTAAEALPMDTPGEYDVVFALMEDRFTARLVVEDTTPPVLELRPLERYLTSELDIEEFVARAEDATALEFSYVTAPDFSRAGTQEVEIRATDQGGNSVTRSALLTLEEDTEPPVLRGVGDLTAYLGSAINYRGNVSVTDNCDRDIRLEVDTSAVVTGEAGTYPIVYSATDRAGNTATAEAELTLIERVYDEETVDALARQVTDRILTPGMSEYEKLSAIYYWVRRSLTYAEQPNMTDWLRAAYEGLSLHRGDCYVYTMTSRALLNAAGIKNMVIDSLPLRYTHFWNLVDIGEGWYHFDTTPRLAGGDFLYWDDAKITAYSEAHANSHIYDRERFPDVQGAPTASVEGPAAATVAETPVTAVTETPAVEETETPAGESASAEETAEAVVETEAEAPVEEAEAPAMEETEGLVVEAAEDAAGDEG